MNVHSKLSMVPADQLNEVVENIKRQPDPKKARVILMMRKNKVEVFENTEAASVCLRLILNAYTGFWTVDQETMANMLDDEDCVCQCYKARMRRHILYDILKVKIII